MLPEDVLGVVAAFFISRDRDIKTFAAVSLSWVRSLAACEELFAYTHEQRMKVESLANPALDNDMWMCDIDDIGTFKYNTEEPTIGIDYRSFLGRAMIAERAAVSGEVEWLSIKGDFFDIGLDGLDTLLGMIESHHIKTLTIDAATDKPPSNRILALVERLTGLESLKLSITLGTLSADAALMSSANTLKVLHVTSKIANSEVLQSLPNLRVLWVLDAEDKVENIAPSVYLPKINKLVNLEELRLQGKLETSNANWLALLSDLTKLHSLEMNSTMHHVDMVFDGISFHESLTFLNMSWVCEAVTTSTVVSIAENCPMLKVLHLTMCQEIKQEGFTALGKLEHLERLELWDAEIRFSALNALRPIKTLQLLSMAGADFEDTDPTIGFLDVFQSFPALTALDVCQSTMPNGPAVSQFVEALPSCPRLQMLELNQLGHRNLGRLADSLYDLDTEALAHLSELRSLNISQTNPTLRTQRSLAKLHNLEVLEIGNEKLDGDILMEIVKSNANLMELSMTKVKEGLTAQHLITVGQLARNLWRLDLDGSDGIEMYREWPLILATAAQQSPQLFRNLATLNISNCQALTDAVLDAWCTHCPTVRRLMVNSCENLTPAGLTSLSKLRLVNFQFHGSKIYSLIVLDHVLRASPDVAVLFTMHRAHFAAREDDVSRYASGSKARADLLHLVERHPSLNSLTLDSSVDDFMKKATFGMRSVS